MKPTVTLEIAEICGIHAGDGYLRNNGYICELDVSGSYEEQAYYDEHVIPLFQKAFGIDVEGRFFPHRNTYGVVIRDDDLVRFMHGLGFPYGMKSLTVQAPSVVFASETLIRRFLRGYFDTDGHVSCQRRTGENYSEYKRTYHYYPRASMVTISADLATDIQDMLSRLHLEFYHRCRERGEDEYPQHVIKFNGADRTRAFMRMINPQNDAKISRYAIWERFGFCPTRITYEERKQILKGNLNPYSFY